MPNRTYTDQQILEMFVIRGRRISAHSLMANGGERIRALAHSSVEVTIGVDAQSSLAPALPPAEEQFESLAARIRPLILSTEPVYHVSVISALRRLVEDAGEAAGLLRQAREDLDRLAQRWAAVDPESGNLQAWSLCRGRVDGTGVQHVATDSVLALGWLYTDLVHVELRPDRAVAGEFSMSQRYVAASQVLSRVAFAAVDTLAFMSALDDAGVVVVDKLAWTEDVVAPVVAQERGQLYLAPPGTEQPDTMSDTWKGFRVEGPRDNSAESKPSHDG